MLTRPEEKSPFFPTIPLAPRQHRRQNICTRLVRDLLDVAKSYFVIAPAPAPAPAAASESEEHLKAEFFNCFSKTMREGPDSLERRVFMRDPLNYIEQHYNHLQNTFKGDWQRFWPLIKALSVSDNMRNRPWEKNWKVLLEKLGQPFLVFTLQFESEHMLESLLNAAFKVGYKFSSLPLCDLIEANKIKQARLISGYSIQVSNMMVNPRHHTGDTALHLAVKCKSDELIIIILGGLFNRRSRDVNPWGANNLTPLHLAAQNGFEKGVKLLLMAHVQNNLTISPRKNLDDPTPFLLAARAGHFETAALFLDEKTFSENPNPVVTADGNRVIYTAFLIHKNELVAMKFFVETINYAKKSIEKLNEEYGDILLGYIHMGEIDGIMEQIEAFIDHPHVDSRQHLKTAIQHAASLKKKNVLLHIIKYARTLKSLANDAEILDWIDSFDPKKIRQYLSKTTEFYSTIFQQTYPGQALPQNEGLLKVLQTQYELITSKINANIKLLKTADPLQLGNLKREQRLPQDELTRLIQSYKQQESFFLEQEKQQLSLVLDPYEQKLEEILFFPLAEAKTLYLSGKGTQAQRNDLHLQSERVKSVIADCKEQLVCARNNPRLLPNLQDLFAPLAASSRELMSTVIVFNTEADRAEQYYARQVEVEQNRRLKQERETLIETFDMQQQEIILFLSTSKNKIDQESHDELAVFLEPIQTEFNQRKAAFDEALQAEDENAVIALRNLIDNSEIARQIQVFKTALSQTQQARDNQHESLQREKVSRSIIVFIDTLRPIIDHSLLKTLINQKHNFVIECRDTMLRLQTLSHNNLAFDDLMHEFRIIEHWFAKNKDHIPAILTQLDQLLTQQLNASSAYTPLRAAQNSIEAAARNEQAPHKNGKRRWIIDETSIAAKKHLENTYDLLQNNPAPLPEQIKQNALLLSLAIVFDQIPEDNSGFVRQARDIRAAIFHALLVDKAPENTTALLLQFVASLLQNKKTNLSDFFGIFSLCTADYGRYLGIIENHIDKLSIYHQKIQADDVNMNDPLVQADLAFRISQTGALLSDLRLASERGDEISIELREKHALLVSRLHMSRQAFSESAKAVRHQGPGAIVESADDFYMALVTALSRETEAERKETAAQEEDQLNAAIQALMGLNLNPHRRPSF